MFNVRFTGHARKQFESIHDDKLKNRLLAIFKYLAQNPHLGKPLVGEMKGQWSYKTFSYRIVYHIAKQELTIIILKIQHRRDVYR